MESSIVDELWGVGVPVVVIFIVWVSVWVFGWLKLGSWDVDGEGGESFAEIGLVRDGAGVGYESYGCIEACSVQLWDEWQG